MMSTSSEDLKQQVEDLKTAQATQAATMAGAQATQTAMQAGTWATMAAGFGGLVIGLFLGIAIAKS